MARHTHHSGAVSLFIVIFTALLITILTVSFARLMLRDQEQATTADLSQSAYDSAQAGVEDAKRALLRYQHACMTGNTATCTQLRTAFGLTDADRTCDTLAKSGIAGTIGAAETPIQQSTGDLKLDQAYTCVTIKLETEDYLGDLQVDESKVIPLRGTAAFDTVELSWFDSRDLPAGSTSGAVTLSSDTSYPLPRPVDWSTRTPALMRAQLMQFGSSFTLGQFDSDSAAGSNAKTLFLYPSRIGVTYPNLVEFASNARLSNTTQPSGISCATDITSGGYACKARLRLTSPIGGGTRTAFLRLAALYRASHYSIRLFNGDTPVMFDAVQPQVDSTGRANDLFRRVQSRIELQDASFPYPEAAIDINGNFCKNFLVTHQASDYSNSCTP